MKNILAVLFALLIITTGTAYAEWTPMPYTDKIGIDTNAFNIYHGDTFGFHSGSKTDSTTILELYRKDLDESIISLYSDTVQFKGADVGRKTGAPGVIINGKTGVMTVGVLSPSSLTVSGVTTLNGDVNATDTLTVTGNTILGTATVAGEANFATVGISGVLTASADVNLGDTLAVADTITVGTSTDGLSTLRFITNGNPNGVDLYLDDTIGSALNIDNGINTSEGIFTGEVQFTGSSISLGNSTSADTVTVTAQIKAATGAGFDYSAGTAGDFIVPNASIGTAEVGVLLDANYDTGSVTSRAVLNYTLAEVDYNTGTVSSRAITDGTIVTADVADSAITCNKLSVAAGTVDYLFTGEVINVSTTPYMIFRAQQAGSIQYAYARGTENSAGNTVSLQLYNATSASVVSDTLTLDANYLDMSVLAENFALTAPAISANDLLILRCITAGGPANVSAVIGYRKNE